MSEKKFSVFNLLELELPGQDALYLKCIAGRLGLERVFTAPDINRPGLALTGFYKSFAYDRVQVFGRGETAYLQTIASDGDYQNIENFFSYNMPCCVFSYNQEPPEFFIKEAEKVGCPILQTPLESTEFSSRLIRAFSKIFAAKKTVHGVLVEVYGIGILITGHSGVGKSETALELIGRGHRLVADDIVELRCVNGNVLLGQGANKLISHHMEIRGIGIINVTQLYGVGVIRTQKEVQLLIELEDWDHNKVYDRIGMEQQYTDLLGIKIPTIQIPVRPGRNLPVIIEAAAANERLKKMGYNSAQDFNQNILKWIEIGEAESTYYNINDDSY